VDLILLNPPFSQPSSKLVEFVEGSTSGVALAFTLQALRFLREDGLAVVILPEGSLTSVRDKNARRYLEDNYTVRIVQKNDPAVFCGVKPRTSILFIQKRRPVESTCIIPNILENKTSQRELLRGKIQMHKLKDFICHSGVPLIHSTSLKNGEVQLDLLSKVSKKNVVVGPSVLFPRVGNVTVGKVAVLSTGVKVVLSDCVIAVICLSDNEAFRLRSIVLDDWSSFESLYSGTGARYITLDKLSDFIHYKMGNL
jgi:hypothetical protein